MAYVMMSRVQSIEQIFILDHLNPAKFYTDRAALEECEHMKTKSLNSNPTSWEQDGAVLKVSLLNIHSLRDKYRDLAADLVMMKSDIIALSETWMETDNDDPLLSLPGYHLKLNSVGQGRGIASYYKPELVS